MTVTMPMTQVTQEIEQAESGYELNRAAELKYSVLPKLLDELRQAEKVQQASRRPPTPPAGTPSASAAEADDQSSAAEAATALEILRDVKARVEQANRDLAQAET